MAYRPQLRAESGGTPGTPGAAPRVLQVFVASDDALAAQALRAALTGDPRLCCVDDVQGADVVVWDWGPDQTLQPSAAALSALGVKPEAQALLVLVADAAGATLASAALALGALGVLRRRTPSAALIAAVISLQLGLCVLDVDLAERCLVAASDLPLAATAEPVAATSGPDIDALTQRESEVLEALALGLSNRAIAVRLGVSVHTVKFHVNAILAKLRVGTRAGAVAKALRRGLVKT